MPQPDLYHLPVKRALIKDGWKITDDPYYIEYKELRLYADLGAEKPLAAEKEDQKIVVEIKVFGSSSQITELERAHWAVQHLSNNFAQERSCAYVISCNCRRHL